MTILVYGSLAPDVVFDVARVPAPGEDVPAAGVHVYAAGGGGNVATALAAWGHTVLAVGNRLGDDPLGRWVETELCVRGITVRSDVVGSGHPTPANGILVTPDGQRTIIGSHYTGVTWQPVPSWSQVTVCVVDAYSGAAGTAVAHEAQRRDIHVIGSDLAGAAGATCRWLVWSAAEHPDPAEAKELASGGTTVIVTAGAGPVTISGPGGMRSIDIAPRIDRDSTGAGDIFVGGLAAAAERGLDVEAAVAVAADVAGRYVEWDRDRGVPPLATMGP